MTVFPLALTMNHSNETLQVFKTGKELNETSSLARTYGANTHLCFLAPPTSSAAHAISSQVGSKPRLVDSIGGMKCARISSVALLTIISSGALVYEFQRKVIHAPEFGMQILQRYQCKRPHAEASLDSRSAQLL